MRVTVVDGLASNEYEIHKHLLAQNSPYFAAVPNFKEGAENHVVLEDMDPTAFQHILHWFYRGCLDPKVLQSRYTLMATWAAADRLMMSKCKNVVMDKLRVACSCPPSDVSLLVFVCRLGYSKDNTLLHYLTDQVAWDCTHYNTYTEEYLSAQVFEELPIELTVALMARIMGETQYLISGRSRLAGRVDEPATRKGCHYHDHVEGEECYLSAE